MEQHVRETKQKHTKIEPTLLMCDCITSRRVVGFELVEGRLITACPDLYINIKSKQTFSDMTGSRVVVRRRNQSMPSFIMFLRRTVRGARTFAVAVGWEVHDTWKFYFRSLVGHNVLLCGFPFTSKIDT